MGNQTEPLGNKSHPLFVMFTKIFFTNFWFRLMMFIIGSILLHSIFYLLLPESFRVNESSDFQYFYYPTAKNLLSGAGYTLDGRFFTLYPPLFPLFIAKALLLARLTGLSDLFVLQSYICIFTALIAITLYEISSLFITQRKYAILAPLALASYPFYLYLAKQPNSEQVFMVFLFAGLYFLTRFLTRVHTLNPLIFLLPGLLIGISSLARPIGIGAGLFFALFTLVFLSIREKKLEVIIPLLMVAGNLLAILPWEVIAYQHTGKVIPISSLGNSAIRYSMTFAGTYFDPQDRIHLPEDVEILMDSLYAQLQPRHQSVAEMGSILLHEISASPLIFGKMILIKMTRAVTATDSQRYDSISPWVQTPTLLLFFASLWVAFKNRPYRLLAAMVTGVFVYFWGMTLIALPLLRYMIPAICFCFVLIPLLAESTLKKPVQIK